MNITKMKTKTTSTFEVYFEKNHFTMVKEQLSNNTFKYTVLESTNLSLSDDFKSRLVMELENVFN